MPLSISIIVDNFEHFKSIEPQMNNRKRRKHLFLIISKETAKFGYEERPSVIWSRSKMCYTCPECGESLYKMESEGSGKNRVKTKVYLTEKSFTHKLANNSICPNSKLVWDTETKTFTEQLCESRLWAPLIKEDDSNWIKLGNKQGWVEIRHLASLFEELTSKAKLDRKESQFVVALSDAIEASRDGENRITRAPRKYPIAKYIKKYYKGKIDYLIADEMHQYKSGDSYQGQAFGDLIGASKKTIGLTGTLLNGYANGLFYILYRTFSHTMIKEGFEYLDENEFARQFGVVRKTSRFNVENGREGNRLNTNEKILPGISPLVFTKFLLENASFISLSDISDGLPNYREIPVPIEMDTELRIAYNNLEEQLRRCASIGGTGGSKVMGALLQTLSVYPDMPYDQPPVVNPENGEVLLTLTSLNKEPREKEARFIELVKSKVAAGEKVLVYYHWTNRTNLGERLPKLLKEEGLEVAVLNSNTTTSKNRENWINNKVSDGIDVLICNPSLVETGLDLLDFTTIIFYQVGYNLFTLRQASRRSWRLSQTKDIEVYFMYYTGTIQEQALSLMATKLQASQAIEGKFSEEGLHAMSNNEDLLTQIASSVVEGIRHTVDIQVFEKNSSMRTQSEDCMLDSILMLDESDYTVKTEIEPVEVTKREPINIPDYTVFKKTKKKKGSKLTGTNIFALEVFEKEKNIGILFKEMF